MLKERLTPWIALGALLGLAVLTTLLAAALPRVTFRGGTPFEERDLPARSWVSTAPYPEPLRWQDYVVAYGPLGALCGGLVVYLVVRGNRWAGPRKPSLRWRTFIGLALLMIALAIVARNHVLESLEGLGEDKELVVTEDTADGGPAPIPSTSSAASPAKPREGQVASMMLQIALAVVILGAAAGLFVTARRRHKKARRATPLPLDLGSAVDVALQELRWGRDPVGVVERCYRDMLRAYAEASGVDPAALTPREFARSVASAGHGSRAMDELTGLFELVHYGGRPDESFSSRAASCMVQLRESVPSTSHAVV